MSEKQSSSIKTGGRGGKREGAGRKAGVPNKRTAAIQQAVEQSGMTPLEYLLSVMRDVGEEPRARLAAAQAAAPYVHAKLSSVEMSGKDGGDIGIVGRIELVPMNGNR